MEDLRQFFSSESIAKLKNLHARLQTAETFSEADRREVFRVLHTLKGSSQIFNFTSASRLAHRLETILSAVQNKENFNGTVKNALVKGVELLILCLQNQQFEIPAEFVEQINSIVPESAEQKTFSNVNLPEIPSEISAQLANQEKAALVSAAGEGKIVYVLEIGFQASKFAAGFKDFRQVLNELGEIVAALPSRKFNNQGKVGFQIVFASFLKSEQIKKIAEQSSAEMIFDASESIFSNDLHGVLSQIVEHGKAVAEKFGKKIEFEISVDAAKLSNRQLTLVFEILTHLIRNAVDHAVEKTGKIEINLKKVDKNLILIVSDDGCGIDSEKIKARAIEKNLISDEEKLDEQEMLRLIFLPQFSTASQVTEISGRGIGLDAVKSAVEEVNGQIKITSRKGQGTTFEIFLPTNEE